MYPQEDYVALSDSDDEASEDILQANLAQQRMALIHIEQVCGVVPCGVLSSLTCTWSLQIRMELEKLDQESDEGCVSCDVCECID